MQFNIKKTISSKVDKIIDNSNIKKACQNNDIPTLFLRTSNILMRCNVLIFEGFQPQNVFHIFLFSMKHSDLFMAKITPKVTHSFLFGILGI